MALATATVVGVGAAVSGVGGASRAAWAESGAVTGVRVGHHAGSSRLTLTLTAPVRFRAATRGDPYRLVILIDRVDWNLAPTVPLGNGLVSSVAFESEGPPARIVARLSGPAKVRKVYALRPRGAATGWRLVFDLERVSKDTFDRLHGAAAPPERSARPRVASAARADPPGAEPSPRAGVHLVADRRSRGRTPLIVLDPGHGGRDTGAISPWGLREKHLVLRFSKILRGRLTKTGKYRVRLTRTKDRFLALRERYRIARRAEADLFLSIHADANPLAQLRGLSVYTLSAQASDRLAERLARRENRSEPIAGVDLDGKSNPVSGILIDLIRRETMQRSVRFADMVVKEAGDTTRLLGKPRRSAGFVVLKAPDVPSVLVELGILTNRADERKLRSAKHLQGLADALARAISRYFGRLAGADRTLAED